MPESVERRMRDHIVFLYGAGRAPALLERLRAILNQFQRRYPQLAAAGERLTERDVILITYGDQMREPSQRPLQTQAQVLEETIAGVVTGVHILPFFPYSSDDGFSVIDYTTVDPKLGDWGDVERLGQSFRLMFDAVINHISAQSQWFQAFLEGAPEFADYFITVEEETDLSQVVRPRALPLLSRVETAHGERSVWTTFSADQIDLNFANPDVLLKIIEILLLYVEKGAEIIRLDAIAYLWKKIGTPCIHLEETHRVVRLLRAVLDAVAPHVLLITETNGPHEENISYFGDGSDEAQLVYQFPLPPLVLHAFHAGSARYLTEWASTLETLSDAVTFFNFLASHDGIGVRPAEGILDPAEVQELVERTLAHGGHVSYKTNSDGTQSAYELNISYFDAISDPNAPESIELQARRFLASQAIMLSLAGVPGIYVHSLFGSRSHQAGVEQTGRYRSINREKFQRDQLEEALADPASLRHQVFYPYLHLIRTRTAHRAFHPNGAQEVLSLHPALFSLIRTSPDGPEAVLCITNVSGEEQHLQIGLDALPLSFSGQVQDLITGVDFPVDVSGDLRLKVAPYQVLWLAGKMVA
jgi:glycosidase